MTGDADFSAADGEAAPGEALELLRHLVVAVHHPERAAHGLHRLVALAGRGR